MSQGALMALEPGDVGLTHGTGIVDWAIRFAEARRYGRNSVEARWNHAFMIVDTAGGLVEAQGRGVVRNTLSREYANSEYVILRPPYPPGGAGRAVAAMQGMLGASYGYLEIVSEALAFLTQTKLRFGVAGQHICSGAVSAAVDQGGVAMGNDEEWNSPADVMHVAIAQKWTWVGGVKV
jgi:hypothetical protein